MFINNQSCVNYESNGTTFKVYLILYHSNIKSKTIQPNYYMNTLRGWIMSVKQCVYNYMVKESYMLSVASHMHHTNTYRNIFWYLPFACRDIKTYVLCCSINFSFTTFTNLATHWYTFNCQWQNLQKVIDEWKKGVSVQTLKWWM